MLFYNKLHPKLHFLKLSYMSYTSKMSSKTYIKQMPLFFYVLSALGYCLSLFLKLSYIKPMIKIFQEISRKLIQNIIVIFYIKNERIVDLQTYQGFSTNDTLIIYLKYVHMRILRYIYQ